MIETSQLQTLIAVTKAMSFSKAADDLGVTQSAISQSIKNLETKLDIKIFKRSGKFVVLTPEGERLHEFGAKFLIKMQETLDDLKDDKDKLQGKVRIGTLVGIGKSWLAHEIVCHASENPDLNLSIQMGTVAELVGAFENNLLDILILPETDIPGHSESEFFLEEKSTLVFPKDHPEFNFENNFSLSYLEELPVILFEKDDHLFYKWCRLAFNLSPKKVNVRFMVNSHGHMLEAVHAGLGIAVVPNHVLDRSYFKDKVSTLSGDFEVPTGKFFIAYQKEAEKLFRIKKTIERLHLHRDNFKT